MVIIKYIVYENKIIYFNISIYIIQVYTHAVRHACPMSTISGD